MNLLIDIGNSTIVIASADSQGEIIDTWRFKTLKSETISFFRKELRLGIIKFDIQPASIDRIMISSVVPEVNDKMTQAVLDIIGKHPQFFSITDAQRVIDIDVESPSQLGKDRIADAIGALGWWNRGEATVIIDLGTATTIGVINPERRFVGGMIIPGVKTSLSALTNRASQLPCISIEAPLHLVGRNTQECMQSGILNGTACMIDGLIDRIVADINVERYSIVATGGMAKYVIPHCKHDIHIEEFLQFKGIFQALQS